MTTKSVCMYKVYSAFEFEKTCLRRCYEDSQKNYSFDQILESLNKNEKIFEKRTTMTLLSL